MADLTSNYSGATPFASLVLIAKDSQRLELYIQRFLRLPESISNILSATETGAYIRGLVKQFNVSLELAPQIAFMILQICIGERVVRDMAQDLQTELGIPNTTAQLIAQDIEKELLQPVMNELNTYLGHKQLSQSTPNSMPPNVLDLKNYKK